MSVDTSQFGFEYKDDEENDGRKSSQLVTSFLSATKLKITTKRKMMQVKRQSKLNLDISASTSCSKDRRCDLLKEASDVQAEEDDVASSGGDVYHHCTGTFNVMSPDEIEDVCYDTIKLSDYIWPIQTAKDNQLTSDYIKELYSGVIDKDKFTSITDKASTQNIDLILKCQVMKANNLIAKDANGLSDPYCLMCVLGKEHIDSKLIRNHNMAEWMEQKIIDGEIARTTVKEKTLNPIWNETFEMRLTDPKEQYLVIELWDRDEELRTKVKGFKGFGRLIADLTMEDDFLGRVFFLLQHVPVGGVTKTLDLLSHSAKHSRGSLTMHMEITGSAGDKSIQDIHILHKNLLKCITLHESKEERRWNGVLSELAERLLSYHVSLYKMTPLHQSAIRLSVFMEYNKVYAIDVSALSGVLQKIQSHEKEDDSTSFWREQLAKDLKELYNYIMDLMKKHLDIFNNFKSEENQDLFKAHLLVLHDLYRINIMKSQLSSEQLDLRAVLTNAIQVAIPHWMLILSANFMPANSSDVEKMTAFKGLCLHCLKQCERSYEVVQPIFNQIGVDYFSPFYTTMCKILHSEAEKVLDLVTSETGITSYEIYHRIKAISQYHDKVDPMFIKSQGINQLSIIMFNSWFKGHVSYWIDVVQSRAKDRLKTAVRLDQIVKYSDKAAFSSSAVDAHAIFLQVVSFWNELEWPDRPQSIGYFTIIVQTLVEMATFYAEQIYTKVQPDNYDGQYFKVSDELCIALNNIHHIRQILHDIDSDLDLPSYYQWLDEDDQEGGPPLSQRADTLKTEVLSSADEDLCNKVNKIINVVEEQLSPNIIKFIPELINAPVDIPPDKVLEPMMDYIIENLGKLGQALLTPIFLNILKDLWIKVVYALQEQYDRIPHVSQSPLLIRLNYVVLNLSDFFEADGNGLDRMDIEFEQYCLLRDNLFMGILSTDDVIRKSCHNLLKQQVYQAKKLIGTLHVSHRYDIQRKMLIVEIVSADNLPGLDRNGKSDPYVSLHLLPTSSFAAANEKVHKTSVKKETLDPIFNETLELRATLDELMKTGSILILAVYDHDIITNDDFTGICVISFDQTPQGSEPKMEHLNLFHYEDDTIALKELQLRSSEKKASDYLKLMKKFVYEGDITSDHPFIALKKK